MTEIGADGAPHAGARLTKVRVYDLAKFDVSVDFTSGITLTRLGKTETLHKLDANQCLDNADCSATQECGPKFCLAYCEVNDPFCCGPSTCQPKAKEPSCCASVM